MYKIAIVDGETIFEFIKATCMEMREFENGRLSPDVTAPDFYYNKLENNDYKIKTYIKYKPITDIHTCEYGLESYIRYYYGMKNS